MRWLRQTPTDPIHILSNHVSERVNLSIRQCGSLYLICTIGLRIKGQIVLVAGEGRQLLRAQVKFRAVAVGLEAGAGGFQVCPVDQDVEIGKPSGGDVPVGREGQGRPLERNGIYPLRFELVQKHLEGGAQEEVFGFDGYEKTRQGLGNLRWQLIPADFFKVQVKKGQEIVTGCHSGSELPVDPAPDQVPYPFGLFRGQSGPGGEKKEPPFRDQHRGPFFMGFS